MLSFFIIFLMENEGDSILSIQKINKHKKYKKHIFLSIKNQSKLYLN